VKTTDWLAAWRALVPKLPREGLEALHSALLQNDQRVLRYPMITSLDGVVPFRASPIAYALWKGQRLKTVEDVVQALKALPTDPMHVVYTWFAFDGDPDDRRRELAEEIWRHLQEGLPSPPPVTRRRAAGSRS
jgi:hypothetical protein